MIIKHREHIKFGLVVMLIGIASFLSMKSAVMVMNQSMEQPAKVIIIDAGHGGKDPGKVGVNQALEKDINLKIAFYLKMFMEQNGYEVIMTRTEDVGLYSDSDSNKQAADLRNRVKLINEKKPILAVSIHQNSFSQESSRGAQVFYYSQSAEGKELGDIVQNQLKKSIPDGNHRVAKSNQNYYMLTKTECPFVIIECGFLSNQAESELLCSEFYQEKMAWAIHLGLSNYLN